MLSLQCDYFKKVDFFPDRRVCSISMPKRFPNVYVKQIPVGPMMNFAYLVGAQSGSDAALIDPAWDVAALIEGAKEDSREIKAILATHGHFDHTNALEEVAKRLTVPVYIHEADAYDISKGLNVHTTDEGSTIEVAGITITCLHTPGHTPGSQCFLVENALFTGDTLFVDGCGRVDLEGGDPKAMTKSLARLARLPDDTMVFPGHNYGGTTTTTIGEQKNSNPYLREESSLLL